MPGKRQAIGTAARLQIRRDREIYATDGGWFQARWHFSFGEYYDPENMGLGLLRVFNHDRLVPGAVWPLHPHHDIEGLTYVVAGHFEHADSLGNDGVLEAGGVQRMTLGAGAWHSERNHSKTEPMEFIQMWVMPDRLGLEPSVEQHQFTVEDRSNRLLRVMRPVGTKGVGITVHQEASVFIARLDPGIEVEHAIEEGKVGYLYLIEGSLTVNDETMGKGDAAKILGQGGVRVKTEKMSEVLLVEAPE